MEIHGRNVLVTGASRGIGEAIARAFAGAGARVVLVARSEGPLKELAGELRGVALPADLADPDEVAALIARVEAECGAIDVLVNNAGVDLVGDFVRDSVAEIERLYRVNLVAPVVLCRQVLPGMIDRGRGHIVNMSSMAGVGAFPGLAPYASSKAGLTHFSAALRGELQGLPIGVTVVELGPIPSDMLDTIMDHEPTARSFDRFKRIQLLADVDKATVAGDVVDAVRRNRRHVRHPKRAIPFAVMTEAPRRIVEALLTGVPHRAR
jgi:short-subunit dehydrogenase